MAIEGGKGGRQGGDENKTEKRTLKHARTQRHAGRKIYRYATRGCSKTYILFFFLIYSNFDFVTCITTFDPNDLAVSRSLPKL